MHVPKPFLATAFLCNCGLTEPQSHLLRRNCKSGLVKTWLVESSGSVCNCISQCASDGSRDDEASSELRSGLGKSAVPYISSRARTVKCVL